MTRQAVLLACLAGLASSVSISSSHIKISQDADRMSSVPMRMYKKDCWKKRPVSSFLQNPGAGLETVTPFETVLKDGFMQADCVKDYMFYYGDKFGNNKLAYNQALISNVSIVKYADVVPGEDQEAMSQAVCFAFCRTVPDMLFFGIANGRDCYCASYYKAMAGDDSMCDAVCEGAPTTMCGGKSKSSLFAMHTCANTAKDLSDSQTKMEDVATDMMDLQKKIETVGTEMQTAAAALQAAFGKIGDPAASNLFQEAKIFAGELTHAAEGATALDTDITALKTSASSMAGNDFTKFSKAKEAEEAIDKMDETTTAATEKVEELEDMNATAAPAEAVNASLGYYSVMYFIDKEFDYTPSTCDGDLLEKPLVGSGNTCATACDNQVGQCVGFQFFESADVTEGGLCFLFSKLKSVTYYSGCDAAAPTFLQKTAPADKKDGPTKPAFQYAAIPGVPPPDMKKGTHCMARFQNFEGTTLKPDPSGKCKQCLRKATEAKRCFE